MRSPTRPGPRSQVATPLLQRSKTHAVAGSEATRGRTSLTCHLSKKADPCPALLSKIQALTGKPFDHMELPQVARYTEGQRYVEHYDGVDPHVRRPRAAAAARPPARPPATPPPAGRAGAICGNPTPRGMRGHGRDGPRGSRAAEPARSAP